MTAREHAAKAAALLDGLESLSQRLEALTEMERLERAATGANAQLNRDMEWSARLATAHALAAIALEHTTSEGGTQ